MEIPVKNSMRKHGLTALLTASLAATTTVLTWGNSALAADDVNLYSTRQPFLMKPLTDAFTKETGIKVNMVYLKKRHA